MKKLNFSSAELISFFVITLVSGFIFSDFAYLGLNSFNLGDAIISFLNFTFIFLILHFVFILSQKFVGSFLGLKVDFDLFYAAPILSLGITLLSFGAIPFLYAGGVLIKPIKAARVGKLRPALSNKELFFIGFVGPLSMLIFSMLLFQPLYLVTDITFFQDFLYAAAALMFFSVLPLPGTNAINIFIYSRKIWLIVFIFGSLTYSLLSFGGFSGYIISLLLSLLFAYLLKNYFFSDILY